MSNARSQKNRFSTSSIVTATITLLSFGSQAHALDLPKPTIDAIEATVQTAVVAAVDGRVSGTAGVYDWRVDFQADMNFTQLPRITCDGRECEAAFVALSRGFDFEVSIPFELFLDGNGKVHNEFLPDGTVTANLHKFIGTLVVLPVRRTSLLTFEAQTAAATAALTPLEGGNVEVDGLSGEFALVGSLAGGAVLGVTGFGVGALAGFLGGNKAEDKIKSEVEKAFIKALKTAGDTASIALREELAKHDAEVIGTLTALVGAVTSL